jgi:hypothetical protein
MTILLTTLRQNKAICSKNIIVVKEIQVSLTTMMFHIAAEATGG